METLGFKIGLAVLQAREAREITQAELAEQVGISEDYYSKIERNLAVPSLEVFVKLCHALSISMDQVLAGVRLHIEPRAKDDERPELRALMRTLRRASPERIRVVRTVLRCLDTDVPELATG